MSIAENLNVVRARIAAACVAAGRDPATVQLLAVSKTHSADAIRSAYQVGQHSFGENYLQEALRKQRELADLAIEWHYIGAIQSNKIRELAQHFSWVHGVASTKIAQRLSQQRLRSQAPLNVCIQVNVSGEISKSGCEPHEVLELASYIGKLPNIQLKGLMCIPHAEHPEGEFALLRNLLKQVQDTCPNAQVAGCSTPWIEPSVLSMGMSADLEVAVAQGSHLVRIGSAIFGLRK